MYKLFKIKKTGDFMSNIKKINILCLFLSIATFFSCGDAVNTNTNLGNLPENNVEIAYIDFVKISIDPYFKLQITEKITECMLGDTIGLAVGVWDTLYSWNNLPKSVIARITKPSGEMRLLILSEDTNGSYTQEVPPPPRRYIIYLSTLKNEMLLTAEIKTKDTILQTILNVRSK